MFFIICDLFERANRSLFCLNSSLEFSFRRIHFASACGKWGRQQKENDSEVGWKAVEATSDSFCAYKSEEKYLFNDKHSTSSLRRLECFSFECFSGGKNKFRWFTQKLNASSNVNLYRNYIPSRKRFAHRYQKNRCVLSSWVIEKMLTSKSDFRSWTTDI